MKPHHLVKKIFDKENLRIKDKVVKAKSKIFYEKFFKYKPRKLYIPLRTYNLGKKRVLDVACGYGSYLVHFGKGSEGIDLSDKHISFLKNLGIKVKKVNVESVFGYKKEFDAVWAVDIFEHVFSPHLFLLNCKDCLKDDGLLFYGFPTIPRNVFQRITGKLIRDTGYKAPEHINAYTRESATFMIERAGFTVIQASPFVFKRNWMERIFAPLTNWLLSYQFVVAKINHEFEGVAVYPPPWIPKDYGIHTGFDYKRHYGGELAEDL